MPEWLNPVIGIIGVIIGVGITEIRQWIERKEKYQALIFEKRLKVHQEALAYCYLAYHSINSDKEKQEKDNKISEMEKWWENNCLLLDEKSRRKMLDLIGEARSYIHGFEKSQTRYLQTFRETLKTIAEGIGTKHLIELKDLKTEDKTFQG